MPDLISQLRQGVTGLQRLRLSTQLERQLQAQYAHLGQLYADGRGPAELEALRAEILRLRAELEQLRQSHTQTPSAVQAQSAEQLAQEQAAQQSTQQRPEAQQPEAQQPETQRPLPPVSGMAARIWQAKEEERDDATEETL